MFALYKAKREITKFFRGTQKYFLSRFYAKLQRARPLAVETRETLIWQRLAEMEEKFRYARKSRRIFYCVCTSIKTATPAANLINVGNFVPIL